MPDRPRTQTENIRAAEQCLQIAAAAPEGSRVRTEEMRKAQKLILRAIQQAGP